jgi:predicted dehydrogenase
MKTDSKATISNESSSGPVASMSVTGPTKLVSRRGFIQSVSVAAAGLGLPRAYSAQKPIAGLENAPKDANASKGWKPVSDRKIRVGIVGYGLCQFGAAFSFQDHPNVEVVAVSDLFPDRCANLAKACRCAKTYPSLEEMVKDDKIEAIFLATDAPSHPSHAILALEHGKHVGSCVPAVYGSLEEADKLFETVKKTGLKYMMFETSSFHEELYSMRLLYKAGTLGKIIYAEGEYFHFTEKPLPSYKDWRVGGPPQWYPTHSNAYYIGVTDGSFTEVSCMGIPSRLDWLQPQNNRYKNPFGTEIALFRTSEGGMARMAESWDTPGHEGDRGRIRGELGSYTTEYEIAEGKTKVVEGLRRPPLPPTVDAGGHRGSHGYLTNEFVESILLNRKPLVSVDVALNMTVSGVVAHQSALKNGELLKIPQYKL